MARTMKETPLATRAARAKLAARHEPYWCSVAGGLVHVGYRKGLRRPVFVARCRGRNGGYVKSTLGVADDAWDADGEHVLTLAQAAARAHAWFQAQRTEKVEAEAPMTVAQAAVRYMEWFSADRKSVATTEAALRVHILPALGDIAVDSLTPEIIRGWLLGLARARARVRSARRGEQRYRDKMDDADEEQRRRRASANRVFTVLKALLNFAYADGKVASNSAWRRVKPFARVDRSRIRFLTVAQSVDLIAGCAEDFGRLVEAALHTAARFSELTRLRAGDVQLEAGKVRIRGKTGEHMAVLTDEGRAFFARVLVGKAPGDLVLVKANGLGWGKGHQAQPIRLACRRAGIMPPIGFHVLRHTCASSMAMAGAPLSVIAAQLGHADTRMVEKHYAHLTPTFIEEEVRRALPSFASAPGPIRLSPATVPRPRP